MLYNKKGTSQIMWIVLGALKVDMMSPATQASKHTLSRLHKT
jgi:hypothetical protein